MNDRIEMGVHLRSLRLQSGLTQRALGQKSRLPYQRISKVENGESEWYVSELFMLCEAMGYDPIRVLSEYNK